jgi:hypothetical protein
LNKNTKENGFLVVVKICGNPALKLPKNIKVTKVHTQNFLTLLLIVAGRSKANLLAINLFISFGMFFVVPARTGLVFVIRVVVFPVFKANYCIHIFRKFFFFFAFHCIGIIFIIVLLYILFPALHRTLRASSVHPWLIFEALLLLF